MTAVSKVTSENAGQILHFHRRPKLKLHSTGKYVKELQELINALGLSIAVDGLFGSETDGAVKYIQREAKLKDNGIVGPVSWALLFGILPGDLSDQIMGTRAVVGAQQIQVINDEFDEKLEGDNGDLTVTDVVHSRTQGMDSYASRLVKYIPSEILAVYLTLRSMIMSSGASCHNHLYWAYWAIFIFGIIVTPLFMWKIQRKITPGKPVNRGVVLISTGAFVAWAIGSAWPFELCEWYQPIYGGMFLIIYTFLMPLFEA